MSFHPRKTPRIYEIIHHALYYNICLFKEYIFRTTMFQQSPMDNIWGAKLSLADNYTNKFKAKSHSDTDNIKTLFKDMQFFIDDLTNSKYSDIVDKIKEDPNFLSKFCRALNDYLYSGLFSIFSKNNLIKLLEKLNGNQKLVDLLVISECAKIIGSALDDFLNSNKAGHEDTLKLLEMITSNQQLTDLLSHANYLGIFYTALEKFLFPLNILNSAEEACERLSSLINLLKFKFSPNNVLILFLNPKIFPLLHKAISQFLKVNVNKKHSNTYELFKLAAELPKLCILLKNNHDGLSCFPEFIEAVKKGLSYPHDEYYDISKLFSIFWDRYQSEAMELFLFSGCLPDVKQEKIINLLENVPSELLHKMNNERDFYNETLLCSNFLDLLLDNIKGWEYNDTNDRKLIELFKLLTKVGPYKILLEDREFRNSIKNAIESAIDIYKSKDDKNIIDMFDMFLHLLIVNEDFQKILFINDNWNKVLEKVLGYQLNNYFEQESFELIYKMFQIKGLHNIVNKLISEFKIKGLGNILNKLISEFEYIQENGSTFDNHLLFFQMLSIKPNLLDILTLNNSFNNNIKMLLDSYEKELSKHKSKRLKRSENFIKIFQYLKHTPELQRSIFEDHSIDIKKLFGLAAKKIVVLKEFRYLLYFESLDNNVDLQRLILDIPEKDYIFKDADTISIKKPSEFKSENFIRLLIFLKNNVILQDIFDFDQNNIYKIKLILQGIDEQQKTKLSTLLLNMKKFLEFKKSKCEEKVLIYEQVFGIFTKLKQKELFLLNIKNFHLNQQNINFISQQNINSKVI